MPVSRQNIKTPKSLVSIMVVAFPGNNQRIARTVLYDFHPASFLKPFQMTVGLRIWNAQIHGQRKQRLGSTSLPYFCFQPGSMGLNVWFHLSFAFCLSQFAQNG